MSILFSASSSLNPYNALPPIKSEADQPSTGEVEESTPEDAGEPVGILAATLPPEIDLKDTKFTLEKGKSPVLCVLIGIFFLYSLFEISLRYVLFEI